MRPRADSRTVRSLLHTSVISTERLFDDIRRLYPVSAPSKCRVDSSQKVIQMSREDSCGLVHGCLGTCHDQRQEEHGPREENDVDRDDYECDFFAFVVLGVGVGEA